MLSDLQTEFVIQCWRRYCTIREENGYSHPSLADVDHSSLFRRLLSGKEIFVKPPPLRYSYPDYELASGKAVYVDEIWDIPSGTFHYEYACKAGYDVCISQSLAWKWIDKANGVLEHKNGDKYKFTKDEDESIAKGRTCGHLQRVT